jgi:hypothetical protein
MTKLLETIINRTARSETRHKFKHRFAEKVLKVSAVSAHGW